VETAAFSTVGERAERDVVTLYEIDEALERPILTRASTHSGGSQPTPRLYGRWDL
jgi:hypothetical protein